MDIKNHIQAAKVSIMVKKIIKLFSEESLAALGVLYFHFTVKCQLSKLTKRLIAVLVLNRSSTFNYGQNKKNKFIFGGVSCAPWCTLFLFHCQMPAFQTHKTFNNCFNFNNKKSNLENIATVAIYNEKTARSNNIMGSKDINREEWYRKCW